MPAGFGSGKICFWNPEMIPFQMIYVRKCFNSGLGGLSDSLRSAPYYITMLRKNNYMNHVNCRFEANNSEKNIDLFSKQVKAKKANMIQVIQIQVKHCPMTGNSSDCS